MGGVLFPGHVHLVPGPQDQEPLRGVCAHGHYIPKIQELSNDQAVPKYATHLVYLTSANNPKGNRAQDHLLNPEQETQTGRYLLVRACGYAG